MQFAFGSGVFWATPLVDANGATVTNPTPLQLGVLQDFSFDISYDTKELYGQSQFPVAVGRGKAKMTLKAKVAQISGLLLGSIAFGQPITNSLTSDYLDLTGSTIPARPADNHGPRSRHRRIKILADESGKESFRTVL